MNLPNRGMLSRIATFLRSLLTGAAATGADLAFIALAVGVFGLSPRMANVPALLLGAAVQFFGNRHFAFDGAAQGSFRRQATFFTLVEVVALLLNGLIYDLVAQAVTLDTLGAVLLRAGVSGAIFLLWSYPLWRRIFRGIDRRSLAKLGTTAA